MPISSPNWPKANPSPTEGVWRWLGRVPFSETAVLQEQLRAGIMAEQAPETLLLLEHDAVITVGRSGQAANVLESETALATRGIAVHRASRGGDVTFHGPGQLVGYPIVRLRTGVRQHVERMAFALVEVLAELGVTAVYRQDAPGLWVGSPGDDAAKICAFGINIHHRITMHGFALNLDPDLSSFGLIVPCGLANCRVTSVRALRGSAPTPAALAPRVAERLSFHLGIAFLNSDNATRMDLA